jgi:hypothetical protein
MTSQSYSSRRQMNVTRYQTSYNIAVKSEFFFGSAELSILIRNVMSKKMVQNLRNSTVSESTLGWSAWVTKDGEMCVKVDGSVHIKISNDCYTY